MKRYGWWFNKELCGSRIGSRRETTIQDYIRNEIEGLSSDHRFNEVMTFINGNVDPLYFDDIDKYYSKHNKLNDNVFLACDGRIIQFMRKMMKRKLKNVKVIIFNEQESGCNYILNKELKEMGIAVSFINLTVFSDKIFERSSIFTQSLNIYLVHPDYNHVDFSLEKEDNSHIIYSKLSGNKIENILLNNSDLILSDEKILDEFFKYYNHAKKLEIGSMGYGQINEIKKIEFSASLRSYFLYYGSLGFGLSEKMDDINKKGLHKKNKKEFMNKCK